MPVTPEEILVTASEMSQGAREEDQRNAVSRAYYAAFHKCRDLASQIDPDGDYSHSSAHQDVPATLIREGLKGRALAHLLTPLRRERNWADYEIEQDCSRPGWGQTLVETAQRTLTKADLY